jgi:hypothetical protein
MKHLILAYDLAWRDCVEAFGDRAIVVLNVDSGPGKVKDKAWARLATPKAYGYVDAVTWRAGRSTAKDPAAIRLECDAWRTLYGVTRIFLDDVTLPVPPVPSTGVIVNPGMHLPRLDYSRFAGVIDYEEESLMGVSAQKPAGRNCMRVARCTPRTWQTAWGTGVSVGLKAMAVVHNPNYQSPPPWWRDMLI